MGDGWAPADYRALRFVGMDDGPVPGFVVRSLDGREVSSTALIGQRPFVVVFFATWCPSCREDLDGLGQTLEQMGQLEVIAVSLDERETLANVPGFLAQRGLAVPCVAGLRYPRFTFAYNPFETVPAVVVVAKSGGLVDYMLGETVEPQRLVRSVNLARRIGRLRAPAPAH
jgi:thiol-disulfide isomerase/thioredoxin